MSPSVSSSAAQAAQSKQAANLWRVVVESRPSGAPNDALARVRAFDDYEAAWQFAQASQSEKTLVLLVDPQGRVLIDTNHGHAFVRADRQVVDLPPGTHRWMMASGRYELIESAPVDRRKNGADGAEEAVEAEVALASLLGRRSVSPKRLGHPGPSLSQIDLMLQAALRAPDHGGLHPWRVIEFRDDQRASLADRFEQEKLKRDPLASAFDRRRARDHALRPPVLLAFVVYRSKLEGLLGRASTDVDALIKVNRELAQVQSELESMTGTQSNLMRRVDTEILVVSIASLDSQSSWKLVTSAFSEFGANLARGVSSAITGIAYLAPWTLMLVLLAWAGRKLWRRQGRANRDA